MIEAKSDPFRALYIHVPFCVSRCAYCDFYTQSVSADDPRIAAFSEQMVMDIRRAGKAGYLSQLETVYLGGGTPSHIGQKYLGQILYTLGLSTYLTEDTEVSLEANPESVTLPLIRDLWALGVNRLSMGVQSFDDRVLETLGRAHDRACALSAIETARERFDNVSIDLMCGIPGQSLESFCESVQTAIDAGVTHISVYPLSIEPGTPFDRRIRNHTLPTPDEDAAADAMDAASDMLAAAGFDRYEVASYARRGYRCRHNIAYWTGVPYLGLGPSAVSMTQDDTQRIRVKDDRVIDSLNAEQRCAEDLMLGMRMTDGWSAEVFARGLSTFPNLGNVIDGLVELKLIESKESTYVPTHRGWLYGNELYGRLLELAP